MQPILHIFKRELTAYFSTPVGYVFMVVFLVLSTTLYVMELFVFGRADMTGFFSWMPMLYMVFVPAVAMRLWSEERKLGTIELLMTLPVNSTQAVLGKFLAGLAFLCVTLLLTFPLPVALFLLGNPDLGPIIGGYLGTVVLGMIYLSIGSFASTLTRDQIVAFITGAVICALFWLTGWEPFIASISDFSKLLGKFFAALGIDTHYYSITRGVVDTRDLVYAVSVTGFFLFLSVLSVERKR